MFEKLLIPTITAFAVLAGAGCGKDQVIDVNTLPCGTARGTAASGEFALEAVVDDYENCPDRIPPAGPIWSYVFCGPTSLTGRPVIVHQYEPGLDGCETGRLEIHCPSGMIDQPDFILKGGIWTDGSFRVGKAVSALGYTFRILMEGEFYALEQGGTLQDHFKGRARVDAENQGVVCTYYVDFTGDRVVR